MSKTTAMRMLIAATRAAGGKLTFPVRYMDEGGNFAMSFDPPLSLEGDTPPVETVTLEWRERSSDDSNDEADEA